MIRSGWCHRFRWRQAFSLAAFSVLGDTASRACSDKKITQGKHRTQAPLSSARCRTDVLFAMLRDGVFCQPQPSGSDA